MHYYCNRVFLIGNFISAFQVLNVELPIQNFNISDVFLLFFLFFFLFAFFYKIMMECNKWEKAYLLCDLCIVVTAIFTLEWYLFNKPSANILFLSIGDVFLSFIFPIIDLLLLLLGVTLIFRPAIFNAKVNCLFYPSINWIGYYGLFVFLLTR